MGWGKVFQTPPSTECLQNSLVYNNSIDLLLVTSDIDDHGVIIVTVDANCVFLEEGNHASIDHGFPPLSTSGRSYILRIWWTYVLWA